MDVWLILLFIFFFIILEFVTGFFFNYKIYLITEKKYYWAALYGAASTFIFAIAITLTAYIASTGGENAGDLWWFIFVAAAAMAIGNYLSAIAVPIFRERFLKQKEAEVSDNDSSNEGNLEIDNAKENEIPWNDEQ